MSYVNKILVIIIVFLSFSCLKDEGNYTYDRDEKIVFNMAFGDVLCPKDDTARFVGDFIFKHLSKEENEAKLKHLSYEWRVGLDSIVSTEKNLKIATKDLAFKANINKTCTMAGTFVVNDNSTGKKYIQRLNYDVKLGYEAYNWILLSEDGENSKLSYLNSSMDATFNFSFELVDSIYMKENKKQIPGHPIKLLNHNAKNISPSHATYIFTDKVNYVLNNESMKYECNLEDQFLDGVPANLKIVDGIAYSLSTCLVTEDGRLFQRLMSSNYLGGKFLSEPYPSDEKGYKIDFIGAGDSRNIHLMYDRKNNRMLGLYFKYKKYGIISRYSHYLNYEQNPAPIDLTNLGSNINVLAASSADNTFGYKGSNEDVVVVYNDNGKTYCAELLVTRNPPYSMVYNENAYKYELPITLDKSSKFYIVPVKEGDIQYCIFYSKGNQVRCYNRETHKDCLVKTCNGNITNLRFDDYRSYFSMYIAITTDNGDWEYLDVTDPEHTRTVQTINVGGRIASISMVSRCF
jgi:hypothetical protein